MNYEIIQLDHQTWRIENNGVRIFLLVGDKKGLLIDSGMTITNAKEIAETLTNLPIELINTHTDRDHVAGNEAFEFVYMHPSEYVNYVNFHHNIELKPIFDGDIIDLGNRIVRIIHLPGHTPGSIALLDVSRRVLISGDPIQDGRIFMFGPMRNMSAYRHGLIHLKQYVSEFDEIYPSHGTIPVYPSIIDHLINGAQMVENGEIQAEEVTVHGKQIHEYNIVVASFLCD